MLSVARRLSFGVSALVLSACGASEPAPTGLPDAPDAVVIEVASADIPSRLRSVVEAWPTPDPGGGPAPVIADGRLDTPTFSPAADVPGPWDIVLFVPSGPAAVAAIGVHLAPDSAAGARVTVFGYLGSTPLTRSGYPAFVERSDRIGFASVDLDSVVLVLPEVVTAHHVWVRFEGVVPSIAELSLYNAEQLERLRGSGAALVALDPGDAQTVPAGVVDAPTDGSGDVAAPDGSGESPATDVLDTVRSMRGGPLENGSGAAEEPMPTDER